MPPIVRVPLIVVVPDPKVRESPLAAVPVRVKFATVPVPLKTAPPEPVRRKDVPLQLNDPVVTVAAAPVAVTVAEFAVIVIPVAVLGTFQTVALAPLMVIALAPIVIVRAFVLLDENDPHEQVCPLVFRVPVVRVTVAVEPIVIASVSCQEPAVPLKVRLARVLVPVVTVWTVVEVLMKEIAEVATSPRV